VAKAPAQVVERESQNLKEYQDRLDRLQKQLGDVQ